MKLVIWSFGSSRAKDSSNDEDLLAQQYGFGFDEYQKTLKNDIVVIAQIEHIKAVNNIESILKTDIDAFIIGPYDITASIGIPGVFDCPAFHECLQKVLDASTKCKKTAGIHIIQPYASEFKELDERYKFIAFSLDTLLFGSKIRDELNEVKKI